MLAKECDALVLGRNIYGLLLARKLAEDNKRVTLIDDERSNHGESFCSQFSEIELEYLKKEGEKRSLACLLEIRKDAKLHPFCVFYGAKSLALGNRPHQNFLELLRKFPQVLSKEFRSQLLLDFGSEEYCEEFDRSYVALCARFSRHLVNYDFLRKVDFSYFANLLPLLFKKIVLDLSFDDQFFLDLHSYLFRSIIFSHSKLAKLFSFIELISPRYQIKSTELLESLEALLRRSGIQINGERAIAFQFKKRRPFGRELFPYQVELSGPNGLIFPRSIYLSGEGHETFGLGIGDKREKADYFYSISSMLSTRPSKSIDALFGAHLASMVFLPQERIYPFKSFQLDRIGEGFSLRAYVFSKIPFREERLREEMMVRIVPLLRERFPRAFIDVKLSPPRPSFDVIGPATTKNYQSLSLDKTTECSPFYALTSPGKKGFVSRFYYLGIRGHSQCAVLGKLALLKHLF